MTLEKICIVGSGNWGSAISTIIGKNVLEHGDVFDKQVHMWVREEEHEGRLLDEWVNKMHMNPKYLPDIRLPENVVAVRDLVAAVKDCTILVFVLPHQFVRATCKAIKGKLHPNAKGLSLIKGVDSSEGGLTLISSVISAQLDGLSMSVLMGANIANEVARGQFCEATLGSTHADQAALFKLMLDTSHFRINIVDDVQGVELCGALKNIVAIAAGLVDGLDLGDNTKAAVIRIGLMEMKGFAELFHTFSRPTETSTPGTRSSTRWETYFESCGVADLITTCFGGRNRRLAELFARTGKSLAQLEVECLNGQKLQGPSTAKDVHAILSAFHRTADFPLFCCVYKVCYEGLPASEFIQHLSSWSVQHHSPPMSPAAHSDL